MHPSYNLQDTHVGVTRLTSASQSRYSSNDGGAILKVTIMELRGNVNVRMRACDAQTLRNPAAGLSGETRNVAWRKYANGNAVEIAGRLD